MVYQAAAFQSITSLPRSSGEPRSGRSPEPEVDAGPSPGLAAFVGKYLRFVWRVARHSGLSHEDADDVTQKVMLTVMRHFEAIEPGRERAYLYRVTHNEARKVRRTRERRREDLGEDAAERVAPHPEADSLLERRRAHDELCRILSRIPDKLREVFVLFELEGFTQAEISATLGVAQGTVASRLRRSRETFEKLAGRFSNRSRGGSP